MGSVVQSGKPIVAVVEQVQAFGVSEGIRNPEPLLSGSASVLEEEHFPGQALTAMQMYQSGSEGNGTREENGRKLCFRLVSC